MEFSLSMTTTSSAYQPYSATNYKTTQSVQNVDLGNLLTITQDYPTISYANIETPIYTTGENYSTSGYQTTDPIYTTTNYGPTSTITTTSDYPVTNYITSVPEITPQYYTTTSYETSAIETIPTTTVDFRAYETIPDVKTTYQKATAPVSITYQAASAPTSQVVTKYEQRIATKIQPGLVTKYVQIPFTKMSQIEQARVISLIQPKTQMSVPTISLIKTPQPIYQTLPAPQHVLIPQLVVSPQPMVSQIIQVPQAPLIGSNDHFVRNYPIYESDPRRVPKTSIFAPQPANPEINYINDFRVRSSLDNYVTSPALSPTNALPNKTKGDYLDFQSNCKDKYSLIKCTYDIKDLNETQIINNRYEDIINEDIESKIKILNMNKKENLITCVSNYYKFE